MMRNLCVAALVAATLLAHTTGALAAPPATDPPTAAALGARWLAARVGPEGWVPDYNGDPSPGATVSTALALAAAGVEPEAFERAVTWLWTDVDGYVVVSGADSPGNIGYLLLVVEAAGLDPTDFGGTDLVSRLQATLGSLEPGLFGSADPTYDGAFRQALAILGLEAAGVVVPAAALAWLVDQQCGAPAASAGGWQAYRADTSQPCAVPDPDTYSGPETNSTALAIEALAAAGTTPAHDALAFLAAAQVAGGGFPFVPGGQVDPNSTALAIQALAAAGEDPAAGRWATGGGDPYTSLLSWQLGCDQVATDVGAFASPFSDGAPDGYATQQAVWGASGHPFPLGTVIFGDAPEPCRAPVARAATAPTAQPPTTTTTCAVASGVVTRPAFTG